MTDVADAAELLETARETLLSRVLPELARDRRYDALMIANVLAIAAREQRLGTGARCDEARRLEQRLRDAGVRLPDEQPGETLVELRKTMRAAIRAGAFDDPARGRALAHDLLQTAGELVAISNPKALREP